MIGSQVNVPGTRGKAILRYTGSIHGKNGAFAGLELLGPIALTRGKNNGDVDGVKYFQVQGPMLGLFLPFERLRAVNPGVEFREMLDEVLALALGPGTDPLVQGPDYSDTIPRPYSGDRLGIYGSTGHGPGSSGPSFGDRRHSPLLSSLSVAKRGASASGIGSNGSNGPTATLSRTSSLSSFTKSPITHRSHSLNLNHSPGPAYGSFGSSPGPFGPAPGQAGLAEELYDLRSKYERTERDMAEKMLILNELRETVQDLQPILKQYETELNDKDKKIAKVRNEFESAREDWRQNLDIMVNTYEANENFYEGKIKELQRRVTEVLLGGDEAREARDEERAQAIKERDQAVKERDEIKESLERKIESLKEEMGLGKTKAGWNEAGQNDELAQRDDELAKQAAELKLRTDELAKRTEELDQKTAALDQKTVELEKQHELVRARDELVLSQAEELAKQQALVATQVSEIDSLSQQLMDIHKFPNDKYQNDTITNLQSQLEAVAHTKQRVLDLEHEKTVLEEENTLLKRELERRHSFEKLEDKNKEVTALQDVINELREQLAREPLATGPGTSPGSSGAELKELKEDMFFKDQEIKALQQQLNKAGETVSTQKQRIKHLEDEARAETGAKDKASATEENGTDATGGASAMAAKDAQILALESTISDLQRTLHELERKLHESLASEMDSLNINDAAAINEMTYRHDIESLHQELEARPTIEELTELQDNIDEMLRLHNNEIYFKDEEIQRVLNENHKLLVRLERALEAGLGLGQGLAPGGSLTGLATVTGSIDPSIGSIESLGSMGPSLPVYKPEVVVDASAGKENWCGLCERDGHSSLNCPYENDIF